LDSLPYLSLVSCTTFYLTIASGFSTAVKASGVDVKDHRAIFLGAGSAGVGVAKQLVEFFIKEGLTEDEARRKFWFVDSNVRLTPPI